MHKLIKFNISHTRRSILPKIKYFHFLFLGVQLWITTGCTPRTYIIKQLSPVFESIEKVYATENDPELVRDAFAFNLKLLDVLAETYPDNRSILLSASTSYTMYAFGFIMEDADRIIVDDYFAGKNIYARAHNLFRRSLNYGLSSLKLDYPDIEVWIEKRDTNKVYFLEADVPALYWTAAGLGGAISSSRGDPEFIIELPKVGWLLEQALQLDPDWNRGAIYNALISFTMNRTDGIQDPVSLATEYYHKALILSEGKDCSLFNSYAENISIKTQNRIEFIELLNRSLAVDLELNPENRLANSLAQNRSKWLLSRSDELFYE